jgi:hypothetical protein
VAQAPGGQGRSRPLAAASWWRGQARTLSLPGIWPLLGADHARCELVLVLVVLLLLMLLLMLLLIPAVCLPVQGVRLDL